MLRQYANELKSYNYLEKITPGYFLDAKDEGRWKVARVQQIKKIGHKISVQVMFDGYSNKYNQTYELSSYSKLAPFRKFTVPYTGDPRYDPRRQQPSKTLEHFMKVLAKISSDMMTWTSQQINQNVRGQLFVFLDYCMTLSAKQQSKYQFDQYMRFLFAYLETVNVVLEKVIEFLKQVEKEGNMDQNLIYVYPKMTWLYAITELLFNCNSLVSKKQQRATFHQYFGKHQSLDAIYNAFYKKIDALKIYEKCQKLMNFKTTTSGKSLSWSIKKQALILMKSLNPQQKIVLPKDTKEVIEFLEYLPYITQKSAISREDEERYRNELIFHLVLNGNFEGKLIGLNQLKRSITWIYSLHSNYRKEREEKEALYTELIKEKNLIGFFLDNLNFNSELFKRSLVVFEFAYRNKLFTKEHFPLVLRLHKDKHELELKNFYASLAEFGHFMDPNDAVECFNFMLKELPVEENFIDLIRNYTTSTIDKNSQFKKAFMNKDQHGFGLIYFWDLINGQAKISKDLMPKVIESFAHLLNNSFFSKQIERFIVSSIKAIKDVKNPEYFLKVIHESIKLCKGSKMNKTIETAERQINVIDAAMSMLRQQENNLSSSGFQNLFQFLEEVNYISRKGLTQSDIIFLWKMDKNKSRSHLLKFLRKFKLRSNEQKSQQRIISKSLDILQIEFIIKNIFESDEMMEGYKEIDMDHYDTIDELILCYLHTKKIIEYNYKHTIRYRKNEFFLEEDKMFLGINFYLKCIEYNHEKYSDVVTKAIKRLVDIFLRPSKDQFPPKIYNEIKAKNWLSLSKAFDGLKNSRLRCFQIQLTQIYGRVKSLNILSSEPVEIRVKQTSTNRSHLFIVPRYTSLWKFRLLINEKFDLKDTNFDIQLVEQNTLTNLQREEDLSVAFINCVKQKNAPSVLVSPSKQQHPHFKTIDAFKAELCDMIGEGLYTNLTLQNSYKPSTSLQILLSLPFLKTLLKSIQTLDFKDWNEILNPQHMKKIEYQLKVIHKVKDIKWIINFISKGGLKHLAEIVLVNLGKKNYQTLNLAMSFFIEAIQFTQKNPLPFGESFFKDILFYEKQKTDDYTNFLVNCFNLIKHSLTKMKLPSLFEKDKMAQILEYVLFSNKKTNVSVNILEICKANNTYLSLNKHMRAFLNFEHLKTKMNDCQQFFQVLRILIERGQLSGISGQVEQLLLAIRSSDIKEKSENQVNELLFGYLSCIYELIKVNRLEDVLAQSKQSFFMYLLNQCLFHPQNIAFRRFKSKQLRELGFKFLEMIDFQTKNHNELDKLLIPMMAKGSWRKQYDWQIEPVQFINKSFTGLKNLAATCYINSLLQQLFYIKNFSSQLMAIDSDMIEDKQNIVREIQNIFGFLKYSQNPSYTTASLCQNFILDGQPIDPRIQTDVDEFFHAVMDKLQRNLQKINKKQIINEVFRGEFSNMIIGQECPHASERIEHFLSIRLEIKNKKTIYQALDEFIKGEILEGDNAYFCDKCDKKVKALKRVCLKDLPPVMIVTLKRFEFDYDTMQKFKLNTYCSFPQNINFLPYTKQGLQDESDARKEDYEYKLKGVVIHYGISEAGHYTSYVRTDNHSWNYFDDERISEFDLKEMENECFGGIEENPFGDDQEKKKNAYLLIYEKVKSPEQLKIVPEEILVQSKVFQLVQEDNVKTKMVNLLFEPNIQNYIFNLSEVNPRVFLIYYHTVFLRSAKRAEKSVQFYQKATEILAKKDLATWYLSQITESLLMEFIMFGEYEAKFIVTSLIIQAMKFSVDLEFMQQCVALLNTKMMMPLIKIFGAAPTLHQEYAKFLASINFGEAVLNLIKGKEIKETSVIKKVQTRKTVSEFGMAASSFIERKFFDVKDLFQAIESIKTGITLDEIKQNCTQIRSKRTLRSLAMITARKYKELNELKKFIGQFLYEQLSKFDPKVGEQSYFGFWLIVIEELVKIKDKDQEQRVISLVKLYMELMKEALVGFKCELMLVNGFFRISLTNSVFRNIVAATVSNDKENKKLMTGLKDWLKDLPNVIANIKNEKWGWWKKAKRQYQGLTTEYVNNEVKPSIKQALSMLNAIIQRHAIEDVKEYLQPGNTGYVEQKNGIDYITIDRRIGFLVEIKDDKTSQRRFINEDEVIKKFI